MLVLDSHFFYVYLLLWIENNQKSTFLLKAKSYDSQIFLLAINSNHTFLIMQQCSITKFTIKFRSFVTIVTKLIVNFLYHICMSMLRMTGIFQELCIVGTIQKYKETTTSTVCEYSCRLSIQGSTSNPNSEGSFATC